jgi:hypothetical protein
MMKAKIEIKMKNGVVIPAGAECSVKPSESPMRAILGYQGQEYRVRSLQLWKYFAGFKKPALKYLDPEYDFAIVPSLMGENVEPDGFDSHGWPSVMMAAGLI